MGAFVASGFSVCMAASGVYADPKQASDWQFQLTPYVWMSGLEGDVGTLLDSNRVRYDFVALLIVLSLILSGTLPCRKASPALLTQSSFSSLAFRLLVRCWIAPEWQKYRGDMIMHYCGRNEAVLIALITVAKALGISPYLLAYCVLTAASD